MSNQIRPIPWDKYISKTLIYKIKPSAAKWYVRHAENYIHYYRNKAISQHTADDVKKYLEYKSENTRILDWQFIQIITALKILFLELLRLPWAKNFPWEGLQEMATTLPDSHPTVCRDYKETSSTLASPDAGGYNGKYPESQKIVFRKYPVPMEGLVRSIRLKHYSIRTEQAYVAWVVRLFRYYSLKKAKAFTRCVIKGRSKIIIFTY